MFWISLFSFVLIICFRNKIIFPNFLSMQLHCTISDKPIEKEVQKIIKQKQKFERMVVTKDEALEMFADNPFKVKILSTKVPDGSRTTVYRCGDLIDLCRGPHVSHTGKVKAFAASKHSAAYWLGDAENDSLQRLYGISFPDKKQLKAWQEMMEKVRHSSTQTFICGGFFRCIEWYLLLLD